MDTSPANLCTNSAHISNDSGISSKERNKLLYSTQDKKILVQSTSITNSDPISGYFCSGTAFNLSKEFLSDMEINSGKRVRLRPQQN